MNTVVRHSPNKIFEARKAENLEEHEIVALFVEPTDNFLDDVVYTKSHHVMQGGRGSGKTMILRRLSFQVAPPQLPQYPFLGCYLSLDPVSLAPLDPAKVGKHNSWMFESYLSGVLIQAVISAFLRCQEALGVSDDSFCAALKSTLSVDDESSNTLGTLLALIDHSNNRTWDVANNLLDDSTRDDVDRVLTFRHVQRATSGLQQLVSSPQCKFFTIFLFDRYDDLSVSQQAITNTLFVGPPPRPFYIKATIKPPDLETLDTSTPGVKLSPRHDFRPVNLEELHTDETYARLATHIAEKQLKLSKETLSSVSLLTDPKKLLQEPNEPDSYAGIDNLLKLSHRNVYGFLSLLERAILYSNERAILSGSPVSVEAQLQSAKSMASTMFSEIAPRVTSDSDSIKHLVNVILRRMKAESKGPYIVFKNARVAASCAIVEKAISESIFKICPEYPGRSVDPADWIVELNRMLLPKEDLDLGTRQDLLISDSQLNEIVREAEQVLRSPSKGKNVDQDELFTPRTSLPLHELATVESIDGLKRFAATKQTRVDELVERYYHSQSVISTAHDGLSKEVWAHFPKYTSQLDKLTVGLAGSFARCEAKTGVSDADVFVVVNGPEHVTFGQEILAVCCDWFTSRRIRVTKRHEKVAPERERFHPFPLVIELKSLLEVTANPPDSDEDLTRRMCLAGESVAIVNAGILNQFQRDVFDSLNSQQFLDVNALPVPLLRAYDGWCNSFRERIEVQEREGISRHKRLLQVSVAQRATLLACIAHTFSGTREAFPSMLEIFTVPPVLRLFHIHKRMGKRNPDITALVRAVLETYNDFLAAANELSRTGFPNQEELVRERAFTCSDHLEKLQEIIVSNTTGSVRRDYSKIKAV